MLERPSRNLSRFQALSVYKNFHEAIKNDRNIVERGFYYRQLKDFYDIFPENQILVLFFEDFKRSSKDFLKRIYDFLELENRSFIPSLLNKKVLKTGSKSPQNRFPFISRFIFKTESMLNKYPRLFNIIKESFLMEYIWKLVKLNRKIVYVDEESDLNINIENHTRKFLYSVYKGDIKKLENLLKKNLNFWKKNS